MVGGGRAGGEKEHHFGGGGLIPELVVLGGGVGVSLAGDSSHGPFGAYDLFRGVGIRGRWNV